MKKIEKLKLVKGIILGMMIAIGIGAYCSACIMILAGFRLFLIPELRAQLLGVGLIALSAAMVYYLVKFGRWTFFLAKRW
jgi:hypothetical protein